MPKQTPKTDRDRYRETLIDGLGLNDITREQCMQGLFKGMFDRGRSKRRDSDRVVQIPRKNRS